RRRRRSPRRGRGPPGWPRGRRRPTSVHAPCELVLDGGREALTDLGDIDLLDDLGEEAAHHQTTGLDLGDAAGAEVEQLLVVEATRRSGVARALDLTGLDLEVRHRVGARTLGEHQVAVELVGVGA